ncbi:MAG: TrmB family transcriptional regulator [Candidatus Odinarchaeota archaeon]
MMVKSEFGNAKKEFEDSLNEIEKKIRSFKSLDSPLVDWQLYALLRRLGLNKYEILAYVALVLGGPQTISELTGKGSKTGIPQPRAYDIMGSLVKYGLVEESTRGKTKIFRSVPPDEGLMNLMDFFSFAKEQVLIRLKNQTKQKRPPYGGIWEIKTKRNIINGAKRVAKAAQSELLIVADLDMLSTLKDTLKDLKSEKNILISAVICGNDVEKMLDWYAFMKIRNRRAFTMPYLIADREYAIMWQRDAFQGTGFQNAVGQVIENSEIIETLIDHFFFTNWKTGKKLAEGYDIELVRRYPIFTCNIQTAIDEIEYLISKKQIPEVIIRGKLTKSKEKIEITGKAMRTTSNWDGGVFTIFLESEGKLWSIGGMEASFEDVQADNITIK